MDLFSNSPKASCVFLLYQKPAITDSTLTLKSVFQSCLMNCPEYAQSPVTRSPTIGIMNELRGNLTSATVYVRNTSLVMTKERSPLVIILEGCYFIDPNGSANELSWVLTNELLIFTKPSPFSIIDESMYDQFTTRQLQLDGWTNDCGSLYVENIHLCQLEDETFRIIGSQGNSHNGFVYFVIILFGNIFIFSSLFFVKERFFKKVNNIRMVAPVNGY